MIIQAGKTSNFNKTSTNAYKHALYEEIRKSGKKSSTEWENSSNVKDEIIPKNEASRI